MNANKHRSCSIHCQMPTHHSTHDTNCIWVQITIQRSSPSDTRYIDCDTEQKEEEGYNRHELQSSYHCMSSCACGTNEKYTFTSKKSLFLLHTMVFNEDDVLQVCEITGCDISLAKQYMEIANGDVNVAISLLLDNAAMPPRAAPDPMDIEDVSSDDTESSESEPERVHRVYDSQGECKCFSLE